jgi:RNA polymerase sigma-70 factor (ECF subfamily)
MDRTPDSARQLASRARRRVRAAPQPDRDVALQRRVVDAFLAAARGGDFEALVEVLDPDVVFRMDLGPDSRVTLRPLAGPSRSRARSWPPRRGSCTWLSRCW